MSDNNSNDNIILKVEGLKKVFGDHVVLENINTTVKKGEVIAIIGPSGCGKSTFLRSLNLLEKPTEGHIYFHGTDICSRQTLLLQQAAPTKTSQSVSVWHISLHY